MGNTVIENINYSAPQVDESCVQRKCKVCGKAFRAKVYNNRTSNKEYCSRTCTRKREYAINREKILAKQRARYIANKRPVLVQKHNSYRCAECGREITEPGRADRKYCSQLCRSRFDTRVNPRIPTDKDRSRNREYARVYRRTNPVLQERHAKYVELCQWRSRNKEQLLRGQNRRQYVKHRDEIRDRAALWAKNNPKRKRESDILYYTYGTSKVSMLCKKVSAIQRALRHNIIASTINHIQKGRTYEAYV